MSENITIRKLTTIKEMQLLQEVERAIWNIPPTPVHQTFTASHNGGIILGAFVEEEMIGFLYSFAGFDGQNPYLCSHMLGILPNYRKSGLGMRMKYQQAKIAKEIGYSKITWTYDPLESLNAYLNLHKLGAVGAYYQENYYGEMRDKLNQGLPSDRFKVEWNIATNTSNAHCNFLFDSEKVLLQMNENMEPSISKAFTNNFLLGDEPWFVAIPENFQAIKQENFQLAKQWRLKTNKVFKALFANGYKAHDLVRYHGNNIIYYVFVK